VTSVVEMWDIFEQPCGQRLEAVLRSELDRLRKLGELRCSNAVAGKLKEISASGSSVCQAVHAPSSKVTLPPRYRDL
jgi:hypothetical protein